MVKEKRRLEFNHIKQQKITNNLNSGFKINHRRSQIFENPIIEHGLKEDIEESKDELSAKEEGSVKSDLKSKSNVYKLEIRGEFNNDSSKLHNLYLQPTITWLTGLMQCFTVME